MRCNPGVFVCLLLLSACAGGRYYATASPKSDTGLAIGVDQRAMAPTAAALEFYKDSGGEVTYRSGFAALDDATNGQPSPVPNPAHGERMLIHQGQLAVEVARTEEAIAEFLGQVQAWGGYMQSQIGTTITVRIPAGKFDAAFEQMRAVGRVLSEMRKANDVTEEYLDIEIRLGNAKESRERLLAILEKAEKVEDILKIEEQLRRLTDEIETMEGRRKFLADQVALATLQVEFRAVSEPPPDQRRRRPSRFRWINFVGAERVMGDF